jgi:CDP-Glycerol:Poly(glycerophosphate) glycerophosphotransferase
MGPFSEYGQVNTLLQEKHKVVFYAESKQYYQYFERLVNDLLESKVTICYITSDADDPLLINNQKGMKVVCIKWMLGFLFSKIKADVMIMTMPDLGNFLFKKSPAVGTYVYIFHAAVSTHQQYRKKAFYNYDAIFCTGEYQHKEIRLAEKMYEQQKKELIRYGYPLLDKIENKIDSVNYKPIILVAPSWFEGCIFEVCIEELLQQLSKLPYNIILRSHPEYEKREKKSFRRIKKLAGSYMNMSLDTTPDVLQSLVSTDILITDRSGIAFEFAFGTGRPVLFIDTVQKQVNPDWKELNIEPIENTLRSQLGIAIPFSALDHLKESIDELEKIRIGFDQKMEQLKKNTFYNSAESYKNGVDFVLSKIVKD